MADQNQHNKFLIDYVRELQHLNNIDLDIIQADIEDVINDPENYAINFVEINFIRYVQRYVLAYKLGQEFAKKNINGIDEIKDDNEKL